MVLEVIYVVRHGFRSNWVVNANTGEYNGSIRSPTGIPSDPALASYGVRQADQLADKITSLDPPVDVIYSSPFYRCIQTIKPAAERLLSQGRQVGKIRIENGLGEFYGRARFDHPSPATMDVLHGHFENLDPTYEKIMVPSKNGETIDGIHDRIAYTLHQIISQLDIEDSQPKALLICTHAASMIAIGRALTGFMPGDPSEENFKCFTCSLSKFTRRSFCTNTHGEEEEKKEDNAVKAISPWSSQHPDDIPYVDWRGGKGVKGGWNCILNGDCSFLDGGEERGWHFSGDESFLVDPNAFNDRLNSGSTTMPTSATDSTDNPEGVTNTAKEELQDKVSRL